MLEFPFNWFPQRVRTKLLSLSARLPASKFPFNWFPQRVRTLSNSDRKEEGAIMWFPFNWFPQRVRTLPDGCLRGGNACVSIQLVSSASEDRTTNVLGSRLRYLFVSIQLVSSASEDMTSSAPRVEDVVSIQLVSSASEDFCGCKYALETLT